MRRLLADGAFVVDVRPIADVAAGHIPGSIAIPLRAQFATWVGWLIPPDRSIVIVRNRDQHPDDIVWPALNIGVESIVGELAGGMPAWTAAGGPVIRTRLVRPDGVAGTVLDVRQDSEYAAGHLPGAVHIELGTLAGNTDAAAAGPAVVMCGHGERAMTGATLLERAGRRDLAVLVGGADDWAKATGRSLDHDA